MRWIVLLTHLSDVLGVFAPVPWTQGGAGSCCFSQLSTLTAASLAAPALSIPVTARGLLSSNPQYILVKNIGMCDDFT